MLNSRLLRQLDRAKSTIRYIPPNGTAGFARSRVRGSSRVPLPPANRMVSTLSIMVRFPGLERMSVPTPEWRIAIGKARDVIQTRGCSPVDCRANLFPHVAPLSASRLSSANDSGRSVAFWR